MPSTPMTPKPLSAERRAENGRKLRNGGINHNDGYIELYDPSHSRRKRGEHIIKAQEAIGKPLPKGAVVHHWNEVRSDNRNENLLICDNQAYHVLIHLRMKAFKACGNPDYRRCRFCDTWDDVSMMWTNSNRSESYHRSCRRKADVCATSRRMNPKFYKPDCPWVLAQDATAYPAGKRP